MVEWFRRFGDIPGLSFEGSTSVDRSKLPGYDAVPELSVYEFEGKQREWLWWPADGGVSSASPAHHRAFGDPAEGVPTAELLQNLHEGLELPGEPSDYHFLIQGCMSELWNRRRKEPEVLEHVEKLAWLDLQLIEARPDAAMYKFSGEFKSFSVGAFSILIDLYEREGFLHEALDVAERAARYGQGDEARHRLLKRIAAVENEHSA